MKKKTLSGEAWGRSLVKAAAQAVVKLKPNSHYWEKSPQPRRFFVPPPELGEAVDQFKAFFSGLAVGEPKRDGMAWEQRLSIASGVLGQFFLRIADPPFSPYPLAPDAIVDRTDQGVWVHGLIIAERIRPAKAVRIIQILLEQG